jgi:hypothetical protein
MSDMAGEEIYFNTNVNTFPRSFKSSTLNAETQRKCFSILAQVILSLKSKQKSLDTDQRWSSSVNIPEELDIFLRSNRS